MAVSDFNTDGLPDHAAITDSSTISVLLSRSGTYQDELRIAVGAGPKSIAAAGLRRNGIMDLAIANKGSRDISVLLGRGDGTFADEVRYPLGGAGPDALFVHDLNGDGHLDLASAAWENNEVFVLLGNGDGTFQKAVPYAVARVGLPPDLLQGAGQGDAAFMMGGAEGPNGTQVGGADGPNLTPLFFSGSVSQPTAGAVSPSENELADSVVGNEHEWAVLLTSFGIAVPWPGREGLRPPLADIFMVNGPGFSTDVEVRAQDGNPVADREDVPGSKADGPLAETPSRPPKDRHAVGGAGADDAGRPAPAAVDESALNSFRMALDAIFGPKRLDGLPGRAGRVLGAGQLGTAPLPASREPKDPASAPDCQAEPPQDGLLPDMTLNSQEPRAGCFVLALPVFGLGMDLRRSQGIVHSPAAAELRGILTSRPGPAPGHQPGRR
jgi:hypothetical protein